MEASVAIQCLPFVEGGDEEVVRIVDEVIAYIKSTGYKYQVGAFETTIEGDYDGLMEIVKNCQLVAAKAGADKIGTYVKIFYQTDGNLMSIDKKTKKHQK